MNEREERVLLFGEDRVKKEEDFEALLDNIEQEYHHWFEQRPPINNNFKHDQLGNHIMWGYNNRWFISQVEDSKLPGEIWKDIVQAFKSVFEA